MITEDNIIIADTTDGIYLLDMNNLRDSPYINKFLNGELDIDIQNYKNSRDMIIWNEDMDLYKNVIFEEGKNKCIN